MAQPQHDRAGEAERPTEAPRQRSPFMVGLLGAAGVAVTYALVRLVYGARAVLAMPLMTRGRVVGAVFLMNLSSNEPYTQAHAENIASVLHQIALAIDNDLLLQATRARLNETSALLEIAEIASSSLDLDEMLRHVLTLSQKMLSVSVGTYLLYDTHSGALAFWQGRGFGIPKDVDTDIHLPVANPRSRIAIVFNSGSPYYSNDLHDGDLDPHLALSSKAQLYNGLLAPLRVQDEPIGVFLVGNKPGGFSRNDAQLLTAMGSHVAAALRNNDLLSSTRERLRETEVLQRIAAITSSTLDLDEMLERSLKEAAELLEVDGAVLMLPDATGNALVPHDPSRYGIAKTLPFHALPLDGSGHMVHVYHTGHPYVSNEPPSDPILDRRNIITYPLNTRNRTLGIVSLINRRSGEFEEAHIELTRAITSQIATSIESAQSFAGERARADLMSHISTVSQELTATLDLNGLMGKVVRAIHELLGYEVVSIMLLEENGQNIVVQASISSVPEVIIPEGYIFPISQGVVGRAIRTGETQIVPNVQIDPDYFTLGNVQVQGSELVVPLRARTRVLGAIEVTSTQHRAFGDMDQLGLETLAAQVSIAIENARLWNQAQRRLLEQSTVHQIGQDLTAILDYNELVNAVVQHLTRALDTAICLLTSYDAERGTHQVEAEFRVGELTRNPEKYRLQPFLGQAIGSHEQSLIDGAVLTRRPVLVYRDAPGITNEQEQYLDQNAIYAQLVLPMIAGDRIVGCLIWIENRAPRDFSGSDVRLAQTLTTQAAIAIENARLFRQAQRQAREQALLRRIAMSMSVMPDLESLLRQLAYESASALEVDNAVVSLRDEDGNFPLSAYYPTNHDPMDTLTGRIQYDPDIPAITRALEQGVTIAFNTGTADDSATATEMAALVGRRPMSVLITPITRRGQAIGLIEASSEVATRIFDQREIQLIEAVANQGAIAIDNVTLSEREQRRLRQLEKLQISARVISSQLQTDLVLEAIVHEAASIFGVETVSLMTPNDDNTYFVVRTSVGLSPKFTYNYRLHIEPQTQLMGDSARPIYSEETDFQAEEEAALMIYEGIKSALTVPLVKAEAQFGLLTLYGKETVRRFTEEERDLARLFASQAATAFENARLFEALEERAVELTKVNRLKSEFLARVSHELRTPMNSINGYSEMLLRATYGALTDKQDDRVQRILRNGRNLLALIDDLLDISKIDAGKMELLIVKVDLREELRATIYNLESQAANKGLYLNLEAPDDLPPVYADSTRLKQIVTNLLGNALKFTKEGGVTVSARVVEEGGEPMVLTAVTDTGIGIRKGDYEIIFDEFRQADGSTTREFGGTGLGLAISKKLVEMMNGRIWVESEPGKGSTFFFVLPVAAPVKAEETQESHN